MRFLEIKNGIVELTGASIIIGLLNDVDEYGLSIYYNGDSRTGIKNFFIGNIHDCHSVLTSIYVQLETDRMNVVIRKESYMPKKIMLMTQQTVTMSL